MGKNCFWAKWEGAMWEKGQVVIGQNGKWSLGEMKKLGKMASGQNEKWAKNRLGEMANGQDRY
jgi:hypothetical protein